MKTRVNIDRLSKKTPSRINLMLGIVIEIALVTAVISAALSGSIT